MLDARKELILKLLVEDYIGSAQPVGSKQLLERHALGVSPATVRNDMAALEQEGYLRAPYTSAGRIPTEQAYVYYLQHLRDKHVRVPAVETHRVMDGSRDTQAALRLLAKRLVELSGETVFVAEDPNTRYLIGVSNLFHKPDFQSLELLQALSHLVDQFDEVVPKMFGLLEDEPQVWIGARNPFGREMSTVVVRYRFDGHEGMLGLMGPLRMDYSRNLALVEWAKEVIDEI